MRYSIRAPLTLLLLFALLSSPWPVVADHTDPQSASLTESDVGPRFRMRDEVTWSSTVWADVEGAGYAVSFEDTMASVGDPDYQVLSHTIFVTHESLPEDFLERVMERIFSGPVAEEWVPIEDRPQVRSFRLQGPTIGDASIWYLQESLFRGRSTELFLVGVQVGHAIAVFIAGGYPGAMTLDQATGLIQIVADRLGSEP